jgi:hypothetical protein
MGVNGLSGISSDTLETYFVKEGKDRVPLDDANGQTILRKRGKGGPSHGSIGSKSVMFILYILILI